MPFKKYILLVVTALSLSCSQNDIDTLDTGPNDPDTSNSFYRGMDLSFQSELQDYNLDYKDSEGNSVELLDFVASKGTNLVRLKLWHTTLDGENGLEDVKAYAQQIKANNMALLLNFHYSDYWADPATQTPPASWQSMTFNELKIAIYNYTKDVLTQLKNQSTLPDIVQIGNETNSGFLWNFGKVWNEFDNNWVNYAALVSEAIKAIKDVDTGNTVKIMLHHSNVENTIFFFERLQPYDLDIDIIGLSYYPQFHTRDLDLVASKLNELASTFNKDILMVEVAYPFTLDWNDNSTNFIGSTDQIIPEFPPTPQGQDDYMAWLVNTIKAIPDNRGIGFCYWAPDWVAFPGNESTSTNGTSWENQCLFDFDLKALPALERFNHN